MTHPDQDLLVDVALGSSVPADLSGHVTACATCTTQIEELRATIRVVQEANRTGLVSPPADLWRAIAADIDMDVDVDMGR